MAGPINIKYTALKPFRPSSATLGVLALAILILAGYAPSADAYVALPSGVTPSETPPIDGGMVKLSNGEYGLFGPGGEQTQALELYSAADEAAIVRRGTALEIKSGATGQGASAVSGATEGDISATNEMHTALVAGGSGGALRGIVNVITKGARWLKALPGMDLVGGSLAGGVVAIGAAAWAGVEIGTSIDEMFGLPTLFETAPVDVAQPQPYIRRYTQGGERFVEEKACNTVIAGHWPDVWRANGDHCELIYEEVGETLIPIEPECRHEYGAYTCEHLGGEQILHGVLIGGTEVTPGLTRFPNRETLSNGDIAIFRDIEQEFTDIELPRESVTPEHFSHSPAIPKVAAPESLAEPVTPRPLSEISTEYLEYLASAAPELGHKEGYVPSPIEVNKLAETLLEQNPETELEDRERKLIAKECLARTNGSSDCKTLPIFISGADVSTASEHDAKALAAVPSWARLNYESSANKESKVPNRKWYKSGPEQCPGEATAGQQCDEFPFWATQEGGPGMTPPTSLEFIHGEDNEEQGRKYGNFATSCKLAIEPQFIVIAPPPSLEIPTAYLCNK